MEAVRTHIDWKSAPVHFQKDRSQTEIAWIQKLSDPSEAEQSRTGGRFPSGFLLRSFSIIVIGYLGFYVALIVIGIGVGMLIDGEQFRQQFEPGVFDKDKPPRFEQVFSKTSAWIMLALNTVSAFGFGYLVSRMAQFAQFGHGLLLAAAFFVTFLRMLFGDNQFAPTWLTIALLGFIPAATLFAAKLCEINRLKRNLK